MAGEKTLGKEEFKETFANFARSAPEKDRLFMRHGEKVFSVASLVTEVRNETVVGKTVMETLNMVAAERGQPVAEQIRLFTENKEFGVMSTVEEARLEKAASRAKAQAVGIRAA